MKRLFLVDDESHALDRIKQIVRRDLAEDFEVAGAATSGREAIERIPQIHPDIILMDVRMPGVSGLDALREIRNQGSRAVFILVTAYERFDIAQEALELGVVDYLLKPVARDRLALALRNAAEVLDRRSEQARRVMEQRVLAEEMRAFVAPAFLHGIMLGERFGPDLDRYLEALDIREPMAVVAAAAFLPARGSLDPEAEIQRLHRAFRATLQYKSKALAGPLVAGHALVLLPLRDEESCPVALAELKRIIEADHGEDLARDALRLGYGAPRPMAAADASWCEALADLLGRRRTPPGAAPAGPRPFQEDTAFLESLEEGSTERARLSLDAILGEFRARPGLALADRYRIITLFGSACRRLCRRGLLEAGAAYASLDLEDLRNAGPGAEFELAVRGRFAALLGLLERTPRYGAHVAKAVAYVKENYGGPLSLEQVGYEVGLSPNRLSRLFVEEMGKGFSDFLIDHRIEKAKELLLEPGASIKQVSVACGYADPNYFSRLFKKVTGLTPTAFAGGGTEAPDGRG